MVHKTDYIYILTNSFQNKNVKVWDELLILYGNDTSSLSTFTRRFWGFIPPAQ